MWKKSVYWKIQALFVTRRILEKNSCFPNSFFLRNFYNCLLDGWETRGLDLSRVFYVSLYLIDLIDSKKTLLRGLVLHPTKSPDVCHCTFTTLYSMLHNRLWIQLESNKEDTILTFDHLMTALVFCCDYQREIRNYSQKAVMKEKTGDISDLIITILKHLLSIPNTKAERSKLKRNLSIYIHEHNLPEEERRPNLLMEVSSSYEGNTLDLKLIKLLLKVGENPNVVGFRHNSPLHLLAMEEIESSHEWLNHDYSERSQQFTSVV